MKLHIVEDNVHKAIAATGRAGYETVVLGYLASALAELRKGKVTAGGRVTCSAEDSACPFLAFDRKAEQPYCVLSLHYLQRDADGCLRPADGCTWED